MAEVCKRVWPALSDGSAPQFENIVLAGTFVLVENRLPLTALPRLLTDHAYRHALLQQVSDPDIVHFFRERFDRWGKETPLMIESTLRRVFLFTFSPVLRHSLGQSENRLNFRELMDNQVSVIFYLGGLDEETQRFLGCLITVGFEVAALSRVDLPPESRSQYHLILDEFSMFSAQSEEALARVLSLARKYGLFLTLAHQTWSQISERLAGALQNCTEIAFKLGRADAQWMAPVFGQFKPLVVKHEVPDPTAQDRSHPIYLSMQEQFESWAQQLQSLEPRHAIVRIGDTTTRLRTLQVPTPKFSRSRVTQIVSEYASRLLSPVSSTSGSLRSTVRLSARGELVFRRVPIDP